MKTFEIIFLIIALLISIFAGLSTIIKMPYSIFLFCLGVIFILPKLIVYIKKEGALEISRDGTKMEALVSYMYKESDKITLHPVLKTLFSLFVWSILIYLIYF